ncbi:MAG: carboxylating nicotinate-nucleotide diphosphorylase, partial [Bacteroidota bacterium]
MADLSYLNSERINAFIDSALREDVGEGDFSSLGSIPQNALKKAQLLIKDDGVIAGLELAKFIFKRVDPDIEVDFFKEDGDKIEKEEIAFVASGSARGILQAERLVLNCLQRMSGVATYTHSLTSLLKGTKTRLLDTRKTTPNFRLPEKWAVSIGGGVNHRFGLFDMVMLKDNHVDYAGGIEPAIEGVKTFLGAQNLSLDIEIEVRNLDELAAVLRVGGVKRIMLDNMLP